MTTKVPIGIIGTGTISHAYIKGCRAFDILDIVACADLLPERAQAIAHQYGILKACSVEELLTDPQIQIVANLTVPHAHAQISLKALEAGKHVYSEKPLGITLEDGKCIVDLAHAKGLLVGCAPETILGTAQQTCRKLLDDEVIGKPLAAVGFWGVYEEGGDPQQDFFFQSGAGPMLDMGPYYVTALINLLGPVERVTGSARVSTPCRVVSHGPFKGRHVKMEAPTHVTGTMDFASGVIATIITSNDIHWGNSLPRMEIYGTKGIINIPDPNMHDGQVQVQMAGKEWKSIILSNGNLIPGHTSTEVTYMRGMGVAELAYAIVDHRPPRVSANLAYHALEVMIAFEHASKNGKHVLIKNQIERPAPLLFSLEQKSI